MAYNTTPFHGKLARSEKNDVSIDFTEGWSLDVQVDTDDISRQGQTFKEALAGQVGWSGSVAAQLVLGNTEQKAIIDSILAGGTTLTDMKFLLDGPTNGYNGSLIFNSFGISPGVGGKVLANFGFVGTGALAISDSQ